jgi:predicted  nucleic acid-binding Zn-ribbon protein
MNHLVWELQLADNRVTQLQRERAKLDDGTHARAERDTLQVAFDSELATLNALNSRRVAKEDELKSAEEKLARQNARLMNVQSAHEVTAFQRDISALTKARGELDEAILTLMDEAESSTGRLSELEARLNAAKTQASEIETTFKREAARLKSELDGAVSQRDAARAGTFARRTEKI